MDSLHGLQQDPFPNWKGGKSNSVCPIQTETGLYEQRNRLINEQTANNRMVNGR